jgi:UPF0716 protein FxsA
MAAFLVVVFVVLPLVELYVIVQVGHVLGILPTLGLLLLVSFLGAWLVKREGLRAWRAFRLAVTEGRVPARETADGALVLLGGALLVAPGFVTDAIGLLCVLPPTRAVVRRLGYAAAARRVGWTEAPRPRKVGARRMPDRRSANEDPPRT